MGSRESVLACSLALAMCLSLSAVPVSALDRSEGDFWVYEGDMEYEGFSVSGGYRYEFERADTITLESGTYDVSVMKVTGSMTGETDDFLGMSASMDMVYDGYVYDIQDSMASVKEDMYTWANITVDYGLDDLLIRTEMHIISEYSPPILTGFVDGETGTGDSWEENTTVKTTATVWMDDDLESTSTDDETMIYSVSVASEEEEVETPAGTFTCLKITVTDELDDYEVYWYSSDVGSWVKLASYVLGDATPYMTLELTEYQYSGDSFGTMMIVFGVGVVAVVVIVVVVLLLLMRKRGQTPTQVQAPVPPPPPQA